MNIKPGAGRCAHGGLLMYIHNELEHTVLSEIDISSTGWEYLCVQVRGRKQGSKNIHFVILQNSLQDCRGYKYF